MAVLNHKTLQKTTIFAFETDPSALRQKYRVQGPKKLPIESRDVSVTPVYKETEYIIQPEGVAVVNQNHSSKQVPSMSNNLNGENPSKAMTPVSFKMTSSSWSSFGYDKQLPKCDNPNVSDNFQKRRQRGSGFHKKLKPNLLQVITNIQVVRDLDKQERLELDNNNEVIFGSSEHREIYETFFPRLAYLNLDATLI
jgi:hypothetical protein